MYDNLMVERKHDFVEMILHHSLTIVLIVFSYMANFWKLGALTMFLHDSSDIWLNLVKTSIETTFKVHIPVGAVVMPGVWFWMRIFVFPIFIKQAWLEDAIEVRFPNYNVEGHRDAELFYIYPLVQAHAVFLGTLWLLHCFWWSLMLKGILGWCFNGFKLVKMQGIDTERVKKVEKIQ